MRILIADDHEFIRKGIRSMLSARTDFEVCGEAVDGQDAVERARQLGPDLIVMDISMPRLNGLDATRLIRQVLPKIDILVLTQHDNPEMMKQALNAGARGYVLKTSISADLVRGIESLRKGDPFFQGIAAKSAYANAGVESELEPNTLYALLSQVPAAICFLSGPEHRFSFVNLQALKTTGRKHMDELIGKTVREALPELEDRLIRLLDRVYDTGIPHVEAGAKATLIGQSGHPEELFFDFIYQPVRSRGGEVEGILVHAVEVTETISARKTVAASEERLRLAQTAAQIGTWEWSAVENTNVLSPELHRIFGTDPSDPNYAQVWSSRVHPDDWHDVQKHMAERQQSGKMDFEYRYNHPDLGLRWLYCKGGRLSDESRMFGVVFDITARKTTEQALRDREQRLRAIVETTPECMALVSCDGTLLHINKPGLSLLGADQPEMVVAKSVYELIAPEDRDSFRKFNEYICRGERGSLEFGIIALDGTRRRIETHSSALRQADGTTIHLAITRDITERTHAERARGLLAAIVDSSDDAIVSKDLNGVITSWNKGAERVFGYTAQEAIGQNITLIIPPGREYEEAQILAQLRRGERIDHFQTIRQRKDGELLNISVTISPLRDMHGRVIGASKVARDITAQKRAEKALRESEQRLRAITDATPIMVWMAGTDKLCYYFNRGWLDFVGRALEQEAGNGWAENVHPDDFDRCLQVYVSSFDARRPFKMEYRLRHHTGQYRWILDCGVPRYTPDGTFEGYVGGCLDIQDQKEAAEKIRIADEAVRLMKAQDDERRHIARELHDSAGQTLTVLGLSLAQLVQKAERIAPELANEGKEIEEVVRQLHREIRTTSYLLHPPLLDDAGLNSALSWYVKGVAERSGVAIDLNISDNFGRLPSDMELAIFRVVQECLTNIHRHAMSKTARVRIARENGSVCIEVRDDGKGIAAERLAQIQSRGSGVGIAGIRERLRQFDGELHIESDGSGTTVSATIPIQREVSATGIESFQTRDY